MNARTVLGGVLLLTAFGCGGEGCTDARGPAAPYLQNRMSLSRDRAPAPGPALRVESLAADAAAGGLPAFVSRSTGGTVEYRWWDGQGWATEEIDRGAVGTVAFARAPDGGVFVAYARGGGEGAQIPRIGPPAEVRRARVPGEGTLYLARRDPSGAWVREAIAARALSPTLEADETHGVHLAFLQPVKGGEYEIAYVRLDGEVVVHQGLGRSVAAHAPGLAVGGGRPRLAYIGLGPKLVMVTGGQSRTFEDAQVSEALLGAPGKMTMALDLVDGPEPAVAWIRPLPGGAVQDEPTPVAYPEGVDPGAYLLLVATLGERGPVLQTVAAVPPQPGAQSLDLVRLPDGTLRVAATVCGVPILAERPGRRGARWSAWVSAPGHGLAAAITQGRAVVATEDRLWFAPFADAAELSPARAAAAAEPRE